MAQFAAPSISVAQVSAASQRPTPPVILSVVADNPYAARANLTVTFENTFDPTRIRGTKVYARYTLADGRKQTRTCTAKVDGNSCVLKSVPRPTGSNVKLAISISARTTINRFTAGTGAALIRYGGTSSYSEIFPLELDARIVPSVNALIPSEVSRGRRAIEARFTLPVPATGEVDPNAKVKVTFVRVDIRHSYSCLSLASSQKCTVTLREGISYLVTTTTYSGKGRKGASSIPFEWTVGPAGYPSS
jgi:hypothetical protein